MELLRSEVLRKKGILLMKLKPNVEEEAFLYIDVLKFPFVWVVVICKMRNVEVVSCYSVDLIFICLGFR